MRINDGVQLRALARRLGGTGILRTTVGFYRGDPRRGGTEIGRAMVDLGPGPSQALADVPWTAPSQAVNVPIVAFVDPDGQVSEANRANNRALRTVAVLPQSSDRVAPTISRFLVNDGAPQTGSTSLTVTLAATDNSGGTGVAKLKLIERTLDPGSQSWVALSETGWITLATDVTATERLQDFDALPGGTNTARVRVMASDGVNATAAEGPLFSVSARAPEVFITSPAPGTRVRQDRDLTLAGYALDPKDGRIATDAALVWTSDRLTRPLGAGPTLLVADLPLGRNVITLAATNRLSVTAAATTTVVIDEPIYAYYMPIGPAKNGGW